MVSGTRDGGDGLGGLIRWGIGTWLAIRGVEHLTGRSIWDLLAEWGEALAARERELARQERERRVLEALREWARAQPLPAPATKLLPETSVQPTAALGLLDGGALDTTPVTITEVDAAWRQKVMHPSVLLVLGKRGSGKSALGYRLLELFRYVARPYVVGVPASARRLLPDWIGIAPTLGEVPPKAVVLVDEAYLAYHARGSMLGESKAMSQVVNLSRQREQTIIFVSQEARQVDRNIASSANVVVFKDLGMLQLEFDRPELGKLAAQARQALGGVSGDKRRWSFAYAPDADFLGLLENELPSFWKPSLSRLFGAGPVAPTARLPKAVTPGEKSQRARELRARGLSYGQIAKTLGVSRGTVVNYLKGYPYRPR